MLQEKPEEISELQKIGIISTSTTPPLIKIPKSTKKKNEKVYPKGHVYDFYRDIQKIIRKAKKEVFLIDSYADEEILDLYLAKMPKTVEIRILTKEPKGNFIKVATKFKMKPGIKFEVRKSNDCHDRLFFIDDQCWISGQSVKDAGKKPTYLVKIDASNIFKKVFDELWKNSVSLV